MRIITGTARGARLKAPKGLDTRPTADRVKESLFSILWERVRGARVLDLFAGTGSLGLEALSRGAAEKELPPFSTLVWQRTVRYGRTTQILILESREAEQEA